MIPRAVVIENDSMPSDQSESRIHQHYGVKVSK